MAEYRSKFRIDGLEETANDLEQVADGFESVEGSAKRAASASEGAKRGFSGVSDASKRAGRELGLNVNLVSEMALGFGSLSPKLRESAIQFATVGNNVVTMGASLGPAGVAIGVLIGALPSLIQMLSGTSDEMADLEIATDSATRSMLDQLDAIKRVREEQARQRRIATGLAPIDELEREVERRRLAMVEAEARLRGPHFALMREEYRSQRDSAERALMLAQENLSAARARQAVEEDTARTIERTAALEARAKEARRSEAASLAGARSRAGRGGRGNAERAERARLADLSAIGREIASNIELQEAEREIREELARLDREKLELTEKMIAREQSAVAAGKQRERERLEEVGARLEQEAKAQALQEQRIALEDLARKRTRQTQDALEGVVDITATAIQLTMSGQQSAKEAFKTAIDEWLKQFAVQEAMKGAAAFAEGVGNAVMNTGHSAAKFAEAAQHFALAAVAGGAAAAIPSGSGGGAAPGPSAADSGGSGGAGGTVVINMNAPIAREDVGAMQARAERANRRRGGRA